MKLAEERPGLELIRETSLAALPALPELPDAVVIDGDHNYWTVREELRLIGERAPGAELPLLLFHDVCWPHGRRDDYFDAELIPEDYRQPMAGARGGLAPGEPGLHPGGLPYPRSAEREGGEHNGVLTAVEDFVASRERLRLVVVPVFFGFGVVWHEDAPYAARARAHPRPVGSQPDPRAARGQPRPPPRAVACASGRAVGGARPARRAGGACCGGCWSRARSRSPSGCRCCGCAPVWPPSSP